MPSKQQIEHPKPTAWDQHFPDVAYSGQVLYADASIPSSCAFRCAPLLLTLILPSPPPIPICKNIAYVADGGLIEMGCTALAALPELRKLCFE